MRASEMRPLWRRNFHVPVKRNLILAVRLLGVEALVSDIPKNRVVTRRAACTEGVDVDIQTRRPTMQKGTVKWFNPTKGYGFIKPATGDRDVFVHISAVERAGLSTLNEGQTVEYELVTNRGKTSAENLKVA
jgi:CspA family cold shock protein